MAIKVKENLGNGTFKVTEDSGKGLFITFVIEMSPKKKGKTNLYRTIIVGTGFNTFRDIPEENIRKIVGEKIFKKEFSCQK
jgi:hypothetical protein